MRMRDDCDGAGAEAEDKFIVQRPLEPDVDYRKMNHNQLATQLNDVIATKDSMQQELNNYAQAKRLHWQDNSLEAIAQK